jgi:hypothetical protein
MVTRVSSAGLATVALGAAALLALGGSATGCGHGSHDYEARALRAEDESAQTKLLGDCQRQLDGGQAEQAVPCYMKAVEINPHDTHAVHGLTRALLATGRDAEARVAAELRLAEIKAGRGEDVNDPSATRALIELLIYSYARKELYASALERIAELGTPTLDQAADQFPAVYGTLRDAQRLAAKGHAREALDKYAEWLAAYGVPDGLLVRQWSDAVLEACATPTADYLAQGDRDAEAKNWVGALAGYGEAFRYWPSEKFAHEGRRKLIEASAFVADPSLLSPTAAELAATAEELVHKDQMGAALRAYRRAVAAAPYWADARHNLAVLLGSVEMYGEAVQQMDWFLALDPSSSRAASARSLRTLWISWRDAPRVALPPPEAPPDAGPAGAAPAPADVRAPVAPKSRY